MMSMSQRRWVRSAASALSPGEVHRAIADALDAAGLADVWVAGTVTSLRIGPRFTSFELVEFAPGGTTVAETLAVGAFPREFGQIEQKLRSTGTVLADGLEVRLHGRLEANGRYGNVRLLVDDVDPRTSVGAAAVARRELVSSLAESGLAEAQRRLVVPGCPRMVGLVTAAGGAGRADVMQILNSSGHDFVVVEEQVAMSGPEAPAAVVSALRRIAKRGVDVVVLARGGGARSDLSAWDAPEVARAIAGCRVPVWVAVGHAIDRSVADTVANASFATPSAAAAELVARADGKRSWAMLDERERDHSEALHRARRRARVAVAVAVIAVLVLLALLL